MVSCPICGQSVKQSNINEHLDSNCVSAIESAVGPPAPVSTCVSASASAPASRFFKTPNAKRDGSVSASQPVPVAGPDLSSSTPVSNFFRTPNAKRDLSFPSTQPALLRSGGSAGHGNSSGNNKRAADAFLTHDENGDLDRPHPDLRPLNGNGYADGHHDGHDHGPRSKRQKPNPLARAAPLAERVRPHTLDEVYGQDLVGRSGVLRGLIEQDRVPSMILWGHAGTGKTTIARAISRMVDSRFIEINSTSTGVAECKKIFTEARNELSLTGRKTIVFCDEIHRFSKTQQDVFLAPVEAGHVTLIGATTENPSFKVQNALLSRCRTFTLAKLTEEDVLAILKRAVSSITDPSPPSPASCAVNPSSASTPGSRLGRDDQHGKSLGQTSGLDPLINDELLSYLASFSDGDARTALNLLELSLSLVSRHPSSPSSTSPPLTLSQLKTSLTRTLVYDRSGDQHYDSISALHKSVRGSDPDAALYYLARMLLSGEDALYIARRLVVMASEDVGLADNSLLSLATATYTACEKVGLPECKINLAHCCVALSLAPKSTRAYRGLKTVERMINDEPGTGGLPVPVHLRNKPTKLIKELHELEEQAESTRSSGLDLEPRGSKSESKERDTATRPNKRGHEHRYKYNPDYQDGKVKQNYLPQKLLGRKFLDDRDLGTEIDPDLESDSGPRPDVHFNSSPTTAPPANVPDAEPQPNPKPKTRMQGDAGIVDDDDDDKIATNHVVVASAADGAIVVDKGHDEERQPREEREGKEGVSPDAEPPEEWQ